MKVDFDKISAKIRQGDYRYLGAGSGRQVYDLGNGYVVKIAKNRKGFAQNKAEHQISFNKKNELFAAITDATPDFRMIVMEKAERCLQISIVARYFHARNKRELYNHPQFHKAITQHNLLANDLFRPQNWGILRGKPVIIDYGFTQYVKRNYY